MSHSYALYGKRQCRPFAGCANPGPTLAAYSVTIWLPTGNCATSLTYWGFLQPARMDQLTVLRRGTRSLYVQDTWLLPPFFTAMSKSRDCGDTSAAGFMHLSPTTSACKSCPRENALAYTFNQHTARHVKRKHRETKSGVSWDTIFVWPPNPRSVT
jgi:hypothetical protein